MKELKMKEAKLALAIENCFIGWDGSFDINIEQECVREGWSYYSVIITYKQYESLDMDFNFSARINDDSECEMDYADQCWQKINKWNMFEWMWLDAIHRNPIYK